MMTAIIILGICVIVAMIVFLFVIFRITATMDELTSKIVQLPTESLESYTDSNTYSGILDHTQEAFNPHNVVTNLEEK